MATETVHASNRTIARAAASAAERFGDRTAVRHRRNDEWHDATFAEVATIVDELALGLIDLGLEPGDRVALLANTRPEWTYSSLAISRAGAIVVPIYPTNSPEECEWVAGNSDAKIVICEDAGQRAKIEQVRGDLDDLEHVIADRRRGPDAAAHAHRSASSASEAAAATAHELERALRRRSRPATRTRSSTRRGRPAPPRASCSATRNATSVGVMVEEIEFVTEGEMTYLYLPLAHAFALTVQLASFDVGTRNRLLRRRHPADHRRSSIADQPTYLPSVPRIFEKLYAAARPERWPTSDRAARAERSSSGSRSGGSAARRGRARRELQRRSTGPRRTLYAQASAGCSAAIRQGGHRRRADRHRRSSSSSTPAACPCSRAGA